MEKRFKVISYVLSPVVFPIVGGLLYFMFLPSYVPKQQVYWVLAIIFGATYLLPVVLLSLFKKTNLITNYFLKTIEERKFPIIMFLGIAVSVGNLLAKSNAVNGLSVFFFGYGCSLAFAYLFLLLKLKISLHTIAIGGLTAFMICLSHFYSLNLLVLIGGLISVGGVMLSARLYLNTHSMKEVFLGYLIGVIGQFITYLVYNM